ncbi:MAG: hypothetical protein J07HQW1_01330 [Haloquadratum walsbyi J07HQW1]|uniref:Uncharacterized protein n=1 Tax=Haloquadratum walsbyi J07HQW1 TaxID=1238424 RepID=U1PGP0_9EURY|nr:MAG: hypothetical protein J07HQW1_01330 [Haloquadratum walsbyi J07HQW1]
MRILNSVSLSCLFPGIPDALPNGVNYVDEWSAGQFARDLTVSITPLRSLLFALQSMVTISRRKLSSESGIATITHRQSILPHID